jgi:hypothetical protein
MKKVLAVLLVAVMVFGSVSVFAENEDNNVTRAEFAKVVVELLGHGDVYWGAWADGSTATAFYDVPFEHWAFRYIQTASALEIIRGNEDGYFRPDDEIFADEAVAVLVRALGYESFANSRGGFPTGYLIAADTAGIRGTINPWPMTAAPVTRALLKNWVNGALNAPIMIQVKFGWDFHSAQPIILDGSGGWPLRTIRAQIWNNEPVYFDGADFVIFWNNAPVYFDGADFVANE